MIEVLALPGWETPPRTLDEWVFQLSELAGPVIVTRESTGVSWVEVASMGLRGYAVIEGTRVEAINFELDALDPGPAARAVEQAAEALGWEVHPDDPDDDPADDDD